MSDEGSEGSSTAALIEALGVKRNATIGLLVGFAVAVAGYAIRVFELLGPVGGARSYPIVGPEAWFLLLAVVFASATALAVTLVLTAIRLIGLSTAEN
ncbi:hypothetical protein EGH24_07225 [Halonotius terrestris]|uniref:Uncharacterized protein n=1 Tax=Halonotius terrestris TaxID=2487750 RepID=A0A8J8PCB8_9EURY|nr:hypothetical protein [Halonotius terrestris]TQQ80939.1 hypothetical protein EGH24_07225 [Halonotius terrestris]